MCNPKHGCNKLNKDTQKLSNVFREDVIYDHSRVLSDSGEKIDQW